MLSKNQYSLFKFWFTVVVIAELLMLIMNKYLFLFYTGIAILFFGGFFLRALHLYPGKREPLILDLSGMAIAFLYAYFAEILKFSNLRFLLIFASSLIILPHLFYIVAKPEV